MKNKILPTIAALLALTSCKPAGPPPITYATTKGVHIHPYDPVTLQTLTNLKNAWHAQAIRMEYNPAYGVTVYNNLVANAAILGLKVVLVTDGPTAPYTPATYVNALMPAVTRYANKRIIWELINEPDNFNPGMSEAQCAAIEVASAKAIRAADPTAVILTGATSGLDSNNGFPYAKALAATAKPYIDGVGFHPYISDTNSIGSLVTYAESVVGKPIYVTEYGTPGQANLGQVMDEVRGRSPLFIAYDYQTEPNDGGNFGLANTGAWQTFAVK